MRSNIRAFAQEREETYAAAVCLLPTDVVSPVQHLKGRFETPSGQLSCTAGHLRIVVSEPALQRQFTWAAVSDHLRSSVKTRAQNRQGTSTAASANLGSIVRANS
jgi:hypothetical protein